MRAKPPLSLRLFLLLLCCAASGLAQQPAARPSLDAIVDSLYAVRQFREAVISPDGARVAWVETVHDAAGAPTSNKAIYVAELGRAVGPARRISAADADTICAEHDVSWSPDSRRLAFLSDCQGPGQLQLFVAAASGGSARQMTRLTGYLADTRWAPDGKSIAVLFTENAPRPAGPLEAMTPDAGVVEEHIYEQRITVVDAATGRGRQVSPPDLYVYEYDWSPDGRSFAATAAHGSGDNNWWIAQLYIINAASGEARSIHQPPYQMAVPRWSPDGKRIAYIGGLMSDQGSTGGDIHVVPATGGEGSNLTPNIKASPSWLSWLAPDRILFVEDVDGQSGVAALDLASGNITTLWTAPELITGSDWGFSLSLARDGKTSAVIRESFAHPPEIWAGPIGQWRPVTQVNRDRRPTWGQARSLHWSSDGMQVQGWLLFPRDYDPSRRYPMVVAAHGGPAGSCKPGWPHSFFAGPLSSAGYFVLCPNFRGSFGQGEAFTRGNVKDFGYGDLRDILAGVDQVLKEFPVDKERLGITGWSYGGYMTMWAVTQTRRFHAAVAGAGLANWQSYYGQNDIDQWLIPYFGASVYDDPAVYARSAPITFIKDVKTPTLVLVGDRDGEVPAPQSYEFWHALKTLGVPTQLVVYPNEGHSIVQPEHKRDLIKRTIAWFDRYLREETPEAPVLRRDPARPQ